MYLKKTDEQNGLIPHDADNEHWSISMDKEYIADPTYTPGLRKITPYKSILNNNIQKQHNKEFSKVHSIERVFGRLKRIWKITSQCYRLDHDNFDIDIENCALLINEHIQIYALLNDDKKHRRKLIHIIIQYFYRKSRKESRNKMIIENGLNRELKMHVQYDSLFK